MEQHILYLINRQWTNAPLDLFMTLMSSKDAWTVPLVIAIAATLVFGGFRARAMVLCGLVVIGIGDGVISESLKKIVARPRPFQVVANVRVLKFQGHGMGAIFQPVQEKMSRPETGNIVGRSFPSAHTMNNFCAAVVLTFFYRRRGALYFIPAACVGYSRIYTGAHWPGDVLTTVFLAIGWSLICLAVFEWLWRRFGSRVMPQVFALHPSLFEGTAA